MDSPHGVVDHIVAGLLAISYQCVLFVHSFCGIFCWEGRVGFLACSAFDLFPSQLPGFEAYVLPFRALQTFLYLDSSPPVFGFVKLSAFNFSAFGLLGFNVHVLKLVHV